MMSVAKPIMTPSFPTGACCSTMLNMSGRAIPAPIPCRIRPTTRRMKCGAAAHTAVPATKTAMAARNSVLLRNLRLRNDEIGMIAERTSR